MKKFSSFAVCAIAAMMFASCGSSGFKADVTKMAKYQCELQQLQGKESTPENEEKIEKLNKEISAFGEELEKKYPDMDKNTERQEEAIKIMQEVNAKCK